MCSSTADMEANEEVAMVLQMCLLYPQELLSPYDANKHQFHQAEAPSKSFL